MLFRFRLSRSFVFKIIKSCDKLYKLYKHAIIVLLFKILYAINFFKIKKCSFCKLIQIKFKENISLNIVKIYFTTKWNIYITYSHKYYKEVINSLNCIFY